MPTYIQPSISNPLKCRLKSGTKGYCQVLRDESTVLFYDDITGGFVKEVSKADVVLV